MGVRVHGAPTFITMRGIVHEPATKPAMSRESYDALLAATAKARGWIEDLRLGRIATLAGIADREGLGEHHVQLLASLALVAPCVVAVIADARGPADLTIPTLAQASPIRGESRIRLAPRCNATYKLLWKHYCGE